jgi:hypothetical protein
MRQSQRKKIRTSRRRKITSRRGKISTSGPKRFTITADHPLVKVVQQSIDWISTEEAIDFIRTKYHFGPISSVEKLIELCQSGKVRSRIRRNEQQVSRTELRYWLRRPGRRRKFEECAAIEGVLSVELERIMREQQLTVTGAARRWVSRSPALNTIEYSPVRRLPDNLRPKTGSR